VIVQRLFRSGNTLRLTIPSYIRRALSALPGDQMMLTITKPGSVSITNLSEETRNPPKRSKRKCRS
jgi:bifunctional DNA-binding transcriptional regulator/antitoxin component of YhaV-PrlF toxin-antitoxin module